ncbi:MAG: hypothetical protein J6T30_02330 [Bacteroidales bacterium]|nr:hypothetical protein [Bacteroidales bacterium]
MLSVTISQNCSDRLIRQLSLLYLNAHIIINNKIDYRLTLFSAFRLRKLGDICFGNFQSLGIIVVCSTVGIGKTLYQILRIYRSYFCRERILVIFMHQSLQFLIKEIILIQNIINKLIAFNIMEDKHTLFSFFHAKRDKVLE